MNMSIFFVDSDVVGTKLIHIFCCNNPVLTVTIMNRRRISVYYDIVCT
jgi:phosphoribosyl-AMP cyclohydrolase